MENQLVKVINESGLDKTKAQVLLENFSNYFEIASDWENKANLLTITSIEQKAEMKMAREGRLFLKEKRVAVEKTRKSLKESALREGQTIDAIAKILTNLILPIEENLEEKEKFIEIQEEKRKAKLRAEREIELQPYIEFVPIGLDFGIMDEENYLKFLKSVKFQLQDKLDLEAKIEAERIENERKYKLHEERKQIAIPFFEFWTDFEKSLHFGEQSESDFNNFIARIKKAKSDKDLQIEKQRKENERLKKEAEAKEKQLAEERAKAEAERKAIEEAAKKEREEAERKLKAEQEASRIAAEKAAAEKEKLEDEIKAKAEAAEKARKEAEVKAIAEQKAKKAAEKKAKNAPDRDKLLEIAKNIDNIAIPEIKGEDAQKILIDVKTLLSKVVIYINEKVKTI